MNEAPLLAFAAKPLLVLHALLAMGLGGATTHLSLVLVRSALGRPPPVRLIRIYAPTVAVLWLAAFAVGLAMYPHFRLDVRAYHLDAEAPWASNLFDVKENLAALVLPLVAWLGLTGRRFTTESHAPLLGAMAVASVSAWVVLLTVIVGGLLVTSVRGV